MTERYAALARKILLRHRREAPVALLGDRRRTVAAVEQALARRARRVVVRRRVVQFGGIAAAAAIVLLAGVASQRRNPAPTVATRATPPGLTILAAPEGSRSAGLVYGADANGPGLPQPAKGGLALGIGARVVAPEGAEVRLGTANGSSLSVERAGELGVKELGTTQTFTLARGAVRAQVAKLQAGERFLITTEDAEIEVHGTVFRVALTAPDAACAGSRTRVSVFEGVVSVRAGGNETFVAAGDAWPADCGTPKADVGADETTATGTEAARDGNARDGHRARPERSGHRTGGLAASAARATNDKGAEPASLLASENDLFAAGVHARKRNQPGEAVRFLSLLIERYPDGPLTESAMVQRMKILTSLDPGSAARAASEYLSRFPTGYARGEAERLAAGRMP